MSSCIDKLNDEALEAVTNKTCEALEMLIRVLANEHHMCPSCTLKVLLSNTLGLVKNAAGPLLDQDDYKQILRFALEEIIMSESAAERIH